MKHKLVVTNISAIISRTIIFLEVLVFSIPATLHGFEGPEVHPFILYRSSDSAFVKERLHREPYTGWFNAGIEQANQVLSMNADWSNPSIPLETKAFYSKVLSCAWALSDSTNTQRFSWAREAALILYNIPSGNYKSNFSDDLTISEASLYWAESYDFLKAGNFDFVIEGYQNVESTIRDRFKKLRDYMSRDTYILFPSSPSIGTDFPSVAYFSSNSLDNHHVKLNASLVVLTLAVFNESGSANVLDHALIRLEAALAVMTVTGIHGEPAGGWAEGPNYNLYSAQQYLAAVQSLKNLGIADMYSDIPELAKTHFLLPQEVMPDGYMPPFDDNEAVVFNIAGLLYSYHAGRTERDLLLWMWDLAGRPVLSAFRADYITGFDDTQPVFSNPVEYSLNPTGFFPESGFARFRNSWENDAIYLFLQSEHGEAHTNGQAHEHPDQNSFILDAYGEMLILDSGYGGWDNHENTRYARNHNLILVNGEGPPGAAQPFGIGPWSINGYGASLTDTLSSTNLDYAASETIYQNTSFVRHVVFPDHRFFFLYDTVASGSQVTYTMLLHGNGGGTSGGTFTQTENGAVWEHGGANLETFTIGSITNLDFQTEENYHAVYERFPMKTHTVLKVSQTDSSASYLTLLYPYPSGTERPFISIADVSGGKGIKTNIAGGDYFGTFAIGSESIIIRDNGLNLATDGDFLYASVNSDNSLKWLLILNGTYADKHDGAILETSAPTTISLDYSTSGKIVGNIINNEVINVTFYNIKVSQVLFRGQPVMYSTDNNNLLFTTNESGEFIIELSPQEVIEPPFNVVVSDVPYGNDRQMRLQWSLSPSESNGLISWYRIFRSRSDILTDPIPLANFASLDSINFYEQYYTILIDSVTAGISEYLDHVPFNNATYYYWLQATGSAGSSVMAPSGITTFIQNSPYKFYLSNAYPNPFNVKTTIKYSIPNESHVILKVFNIEGKEIATLTDEIMSAGVHSVTWDAKDLPSGIYFYTIKSGKYLKSMKMILLK